MSSSSNSDSWPSRKYELPPDNKRDTMLTAVDKAADRENLMASESSPEPGEKAVEPQPPNPLYRPKTLKFWMTIVCNFLALFLVALDRTIIATAVPRISDEFHTLQDVGWYGSAYMLTTSCAQLIYGRIYKFYNMKWVFLSSVVIFEVGSAICGAAPTSTIFIIGRAVAGWGSAGIFSGCMLIMIPMIPLHRRPMFQSMFGLIFGVSSVLGPLLGGVFATITWRWCFWINLPVGAVTFIFMIFWWNPPPQHFDSGTQLNHLQRLDPIGLFFLLPSVVCLLLALQWAGSTFAWNDWRIIMLLALFGVLLLAFAAVQILKPDTAVIPPRVIMQRSVACGTLFTFFLAGSMLMLVYYVPLWLQTVQDVSPLRSGILTLPLVLALVASSIISGIATQKIGYYVPSMLTAPTLMTVGEGLMSTWKRTSPQSHWIGFQFIAGFGLGFGMQQSALAIQAVLPPGDIPTGIAINFFMQQLGGAIFTSVGQTVLTNLLTSRLAGVPGIGAGGIGGEGATNLAKNVPPEYVDKVIDAYDYACTRIFLTAMGLALASLLCAAGMEWKNIKKGKNGPAAPSAGPAVPEAGHMLPKVGVDHGHGASFEMAQRSEKLADSRTDSRLMDSRSTYRTSDLNSIGGFEFEFNRHNRRYTRDSNWGESIRDSGFTGISEIERPLVGRQCRHCGHH